MKIPGHTEALSRREKAVLKTIDSLAIFGGTEKGVLERGEALAALKLKDVFSDPKDREIAASLLQRFFPDAAAPSTAPVAPARRLIAPGLVDVPSKSRLQGLWAPKSIAVIGADAAGSVGGAVVDNLKSSGFPGKVQAQASAAKVRGKVELAVLTLLAPEVPAAIEALAKKGTRNFVIVSGGFRETGAAGKALEDQLKSLARQHGLNIAGPNALGVVTPTMNASYAATGASAGGIGLVSQSGAILTTMLADLSRTGFAKAVSIGSQPCLGFSDYIEDLGKDPNTKVIAAYIEDVADGARFLDVATRVSKEKPIVVLKSGKSKAGQSASMSHTGTIAGSSAAYEAAFRKAGVLEVSTQEELYDVTKTFASKQPLPALSPSVDGEGGRNRVCVLTNAGGLAILVADAMEKSAKGKPSMELAQLSPETQAKLAKLFASHGSAKNPVDLLGHADAERYRAAIQIINADPGVDSIICCCSPQAMTNGDAIAQVLVEEGGKKPILATFQGTAAMAVADEILERSGVPNFASAERVARAMGRLSDYAVVKARPSFTPVAPVIDRAKVKATEEQIGWSKGGRFGPGDVVKLLGAYGMPTVTKVFCADKASAVAAARAQGYPIVLKIDSPDIEHKNQAGGVVVGIKDEAAFGVAYDEMMARIKKGHPKARINGVEVQHMAPAGHELIVGILQDPTFGPMVMIGKGGNLIEASNDVRFELAPMNEETIDAMLKSLRMYPELVGARGIQSVNLEGIKDVLRRASALAADNEGRILELDINPLMAPSGSKELWALDGRALVAPIDGPLNSDTSRTSTVSGATT
ncbi:MAG: acetate--CoA ligase family protein [Deltaproteobacteria bacterium]|nr:acetate--CoA ligase family protein [Deltaproteobacteria bacterium]